MRADIKERILMIERGEVSEGYKKNKTNIIPKDWIVGKLGNYVIDMKSGLSRKLSDTDIGLPVIRSNNIANNKVNFNEIKYWYLEDPQGSDTKTYFLQDGDILVNFINSISQIGKAAIFKNKVGRNVIFTTNILKMTLCEKLNASYFLYFSETEKYSSYIKSITKPAINQASFTTVEYKQMDLLIPPLLEQQKISSIISVWHRAIELKQKLLEQKRLQKKGIMERLLTGKVRIPGFKDEWKTKKLKEISKRKNKTSDDGNIPVLTISSLCGFLLQSDRFSKVIAGENLSKYILLEENEFSYNKGNSKTYPCGCIFRLERYNAALVPNVYYSFALPGQNTKFYKYYFESGLIDRQLRKVINTGVRNDGLLNLDADDFFDIRIFVPPMAEQEKIAQILDAFDQETEQLEKHLDFLKTQKRGLMQLLLTGKVRVPC